MRRPRFIAGAVVVVATIALAACGGSSSGHATTATDRGSVADEPARSSAGIPRGGHYAALGSSFAAGPGIPTQSTACLRSDQNYPHLVAAKLGLALDDVSCSGATTANVLTVAQGSAPPQIDAVRADDALVTMTIGGNDIDYSATAFVCAADAKRGRSCLPTVDRAAITEAEAQLPSRLEAVIAAVRSRAPKATIVLVTYPEVVPPEGAACPHLGLLPADAAFIAQMGADLERTFLEVVQRTHVLVADPYAVGDGHGPCAPAATRWVEGAVPRSPGFPFHPNGNGHQEMAHLVLAVVDG